ADFFAFTLFLTYIRNQPNSMGKWFDKHFSMNRKELQGLSFLTVVVILLWFLPDFFQIIKPHKANPDFASREKVIQQFLAQQSGETNAILATEDIQLEPEYFLFNPNELTASEGIRLGLSDYQIRMIQNYVAKGGRFYTTGDFAKIYAISEQDYQRLAPYIKLEGRPPIQENEFKQTVIN